MKNVTRYKTPNLSNDYMIKVNQTKSYRKRANEIAILNEFKEA